MADFIIPGCAVIADMSAHSFCTLFKQSVGQTPNDFRSTRRIKKSKEPLLNKPDTPLSWIAHACGFASQSNFIDSFRRAEKTTPDRWRRNQLFENTGEKIIKAAENKGLADAPTGRGPSPAIVIAKSACCL